MSDAKPIPNLPFDERAAHLRADMVSQQIMRRGVRDAAVLAAMGEVPRERFVDAAWTHQAYEDRPLPIDQEQTISQPYIVAAMIEAARVQPGDVVLEVGAGSGYAAAVLSRIARRVYAIERHASLAQTARQRLERLGYANAEIIHGDGWQGWPKSRDLPESSAPPRFNVIIVSAAAPQVPPALKAQLALGGRLVMPVGDSMGQWLLKITRTADTFEEQQLEEVRFVPLIPSRA